jgi:hypothetical protein
MRRNIDRAQIRDDHPLRALSPFHQAEYDKAVKAQEDTWAAADKAKGDSR